MRWNIKCIVQNKYLINVRDYYCKIFLLGGIYQWKKQDLQSQVELVLSFA